MILATLAKLRRADLNLSLAAVGEKAGLSPTAVLHIEKGLPRDFKVSTILGLSKALRLPVKQVFAAAVETIEVASCLPRTEYIDGLERSFAEVIDFQKGDTSG